MKSAPPDVVLLLGGARSGKSRRAVALADETGLSPHLIATGSAGDAEMAERIKRHRAERPSHWTTIEEPLDLCGALGATAATDRILVADCLTFWLANLMFGGHNHVAEIDRLAQFIPDLRSPIILVSNEVGFGIVPENALAREFRDAQGRLNQRMATIAGRVELVVAGLSLTIKG